MSFIQYTPMRCNISLCKTCVQSLRLQRITVITDTVVCLLWASAKFFFKHFLQQICESFFFSLEGVKLQSQCLPAANPSDGIFKLSFVQVVILCQLAAGTPVIVCTGQFEENSDQTARHCLGGVCRVSLVFRQTNCCRLGLCVRDGKADDPYHVKGCIYYIQYILQTYIVYSIYYVQYILRIVYTMYSIY